MSFKEYKLFSSSLTNQKLFLKVAPVYLHVFLLFFIMHFWISTNHMFIACRSPVLFWRDPPPILFSLQNNNFDWGRVVCLSRPSSPSPSDRIWLTGSVTRCLSLFLPIFNIRVASHFPCVGHVAERNSQQLLFSRNSWSLFQCLSAESLVHRNWKQVW